MKTPRRTKSGRTAKVDRKAARAVKAAVRPAARTVKAPRRSARAPARKAAAAKAAPAKNPKAARKADAAPDARRIAAAKRTWESTELASTRAKMPLRRA